MNDVSDILKYVKRLEGEGFPRNQAEAIIEEGDKMVANAVKDVLDKFDHDSKLREERYRKEMAELEAGRRELKDDLEAGRRELKDEVRASINELRTTNKWLVGSIAVPIGLAVIGMAIKYIFFQ